MLILTPTPWNCLITLTCTVHSPFAKINLHCARPCIHSYIVGKIKVRNGSTNFTRLHGFNRCNNWWWLWHWMTATGRVGGDNSRLDVLDWWPVVDSVLVCITVTKFGKYRPWCACWISGGRNMIEDVFIGTSRVERREGCKLPTGASLSCSQNPRSVQRTNSERVIYASLALFLYNIF